VVLTAALVSLVLVLWSLFAAGNVPLDGVRDFSHSLEKANAFVQSAAISLGGITIRILDFCGCALVCKKYRMKAKGSRSVLESFISCALMKYGGRVLVGILLGQSWPCILNHLYSPALVLTYWLTFCCPGNLYWRIMSTNGSIQWLFKLGQAISVAHSVTGRGVDSACISDMPSAICIAAGILAGSGGGLMTQWLRLLEKPSNRFSLPKATLFNISDPDLCKRLVHCSILSGLYFFLRSAQIRGDYDLLTTASVQTAIVGMNTMHYFIISIDPQLDLYCYVWSLTKLFFNVPDSILSSEDKPTTENAVSKENHQMNVMNDTSSAVEDKTTCLGQVDVVTDVSSDNDTSHEGSSDAGSAGSTVYSKKGRTAAFHEARPRTRSNVRRRRQ
jgi:hypothetical protein